MNRQHFIHFPLSSRRFYASGGFPSPNPSSEATAAVVDLRIYCCLGLEKPLQDRNVAVRGCVVQRCLASGAAAPWPSPQAEPNGPEGEKNSEKILASKIEVLEILAKIPFSTS